MKKLLPFLFLLSAIHCYGQPTRMGFNQIKFDSTIFKATTISGDPNFIRVDSNWVKLFSSGGGGGTWGSITGTLGNQTDLQSALNAKQNLITTGTTLQYFRGDLSLATFPTNVSVFSNDAGYLVLADIASKLNISDTLLMLSNYLAALNLRVPTSRTLTINGTTFDLSANRTWTIPTGGGEPLDATLAIGNTSGGNWIMMSDADLITSADGSRALELNDNFIQLRQDALSSLPNLYMDANFWEIGSTTTNRFIHSDAISTHNKHDVLIELDAPTIQFNQQTGATTSMATLSTNGVLGRAVIPTGTVSSFAYVPSANITGTVLTPTTTPTLTTDLVPTLGIVTPCTNCNVTFDGNGRALTATSGSGGLTIIDLGSGGTPTTGTPGSVLFIGATATIEEDNPNFFWDDGNNRMGIKKNNPLSELDVAGFINADSAYRINNIFFASQNVPSQNIRIGRFSGNSITSGTQNLMIGLNAGQNNTTGVTNTYVGNDAGLNTNGNNNIMIGGISDFGTGGTKNNNILIGSAINITGSTDGIYIGTTTGSPITNSANNIFIGNLITSTSLTRAGSIALGNAASSSADNQFAVADAITQLKFRGNNYVMPATSTIGSLTNDGVGNLTWAVGATGIQTINADATAAQTLVATTAGTNFTISDPGAGVHNFNLPISSATNTGKLLNTDWTTFNSKESALTFTTPLIRTVNAISILQSGIATNGYLSSTDWNTFNNKLTTVSHDLTMTGDGTAGSPLSVVGGTLSAVLTNTHIFVGNALNLATDVAVSGDATMANTGALTIANDAISYAKIQNVTTNKLLGRATAGSGDMEEITLGANISLVGTTLNAAGSGITIGTTTITSGTNTRVLFNNSGVVGEYTITGTGNVAMSTSPSFTTPVLGTPTSGNLANCTFPTLNQSTTGSAATLTTGRTIGMTGDVSWTSASFDGSANVTGTSAIGANKVTLGMLATQTALTVVGNNTNSTATPVAINMLSLDTMIGEKSIILSTDTTDVTTVYKDIPELTVYVEANKNYIFKLSGSMSATTTQGGRLSMVCPAGGTIDWNPWGNTSSGTASAGASTGGNSKINGGSSATYCTVAATDLAWRVEGSLRNGATAGYLKIQFKTQNAANVFKIYAGATICVKRVN